MDPARALTLQRLASFEIGRSTELSQSGGGCVDGRRTPEEHDGTRRDETTVWKVCTGAEERVAERSLAQRKRDREVKATC